MKLSELRSAIRKMKGNPSVVVELTPDIPMVLVLQKTPTLETLGLAYVDMGNADIGLTIDENTGIIRGPLSPSLEVNFGPDVGLERLDDDEEDML